MTARQVVYSRAGMGSPGSRDLNRVQRVLRSLIWFGLFVVLGGLTLAVAALLGWFLNLPMLGAAALVIGGVASVAIPGMISSCLYIIPGSQHSRHPCGSPGVTFSLCTRFSLPTTEPFSLDMTQVCSE